MRWLLAEAAAPILTEDTAWGCTSLWGCGPGCLYDRRSQGRHPLGPPGGADLPAAPASLLRLTLAQPWPLWGGEGSPRVRQAHS